MGKQMDQVVRDSVDALSRSKDAHVIEWACPVPFFGNVHDAQIATVGINPSNREFVDAKGQELAKGEQRLVTLRSLGLGSWGDASDHVVSEVVRACLNYFERNPYTQWFNVLDRLLRNAGYSYYSGRACHLDLVAFATRNKWGALPAIVRDQMIEDGRAAVVRLLRESQISILVLNGQSVVREFEQMAGMQFSRARVIGWDLPRASGRGVKGYQYLEKISSLSGYDLGREFSVIGFNHNLQSSFGVTRAVMDSIGQRVGDEVRGYASCD